MIARASFRVALLLAAVGAAAAACGPAAAAHAATATMSADEVSDSAGGVTLQARASTLLYRPLHFVGRARVAPGTLIEIQRRGRQTWGRWANTAHGFARRDGSFSATWPANHIGRFLIRVLVRSRRSARIASVSPSLTVTVYRPAIATWYGPGFYGQSTACGQVLRPQTLGVAHRTLPCGTLVALLYGGRTIVVPVIDRGPYANNADWDLTSGTARALGISATVSLGAVSLAGAR